jgi:hypothetical protein
MTMNRRLENMIRAKEMGLPIPKVDKDGQLVIGGGESGADYNERSEEKPKVTRRNLFGRFFGSRTMTGFVRNA